MNRNRNKKRNRHHEKRNKTSKQSRNISNNGRIGEGCPCATSSSDDATAIDKTEDQVNSTDQGELIQNSSNFANMIPEFDPSNEESHINNFLLKVNECAKTFQWDDEDTSCYALSKLKGVARIWLQDLTSVTYSWRRWQDLLRKAFPYNAEYPEILRLMLDRHLKLGDDVEEYYYDKMALLFPCHISGKNAVDCIIHGIEDFSVKLAATEAQCSDPVEMLNLLKDIYFEQGDSKGGWCV